MKHVWRYRIDEPLTTAHNALSGIEFANRWLTIHDCTMTVAARYAWDGCSPAVRLMRSMYWAGPPDGPCAKDGRPAAWRASLFHDALCQFRGDVRGATRTIATQVFAAELADAPAWMRVLYPTAVQLFGPQDFGGPDAP